LDVIIESNKALSEQVQQLGWAFAISVFLIVVVVSILIGTMAHQGYKDRLSREDNNKQRKEHSELVDWVREVLVEQLSATRSMMDRAASALEKMAASQEVQSNAFNCWQASHREIMKAIKEMIAREARIERHVKELDCSQHECGNDKAKSTPSASDRAGYP
jgi:hypothetical protein